jgi:CRP-like cAMP-binding protein
MWARRRMTELLSRLDDAERAALRRAATARRFRKGATLFNEGDHSDRVLVLVSGRVKICSFTRDGRELILAVRGPGDLLGELSAIDGEARSATAIALEEVEALDLDGGAFQAYLESNPRLAVLLLRMVTSRLRDADRKRIEFGAHETVGRVASRLVEMADRYGEPADGGIRIELPLSQEELAGWTGSSREAVAKALRTLRERGLIRTHRRGITVIDLDELRRRSL